MKKTPFLSILIPTRNRSYYLPYAIASALSVPSSDVEIIVSENFGDDDGIKVARSFQDPRLEVIQPPRSLAMHDHFEFMLARSSGEWVTFIGDDDGILPNALGSLEKIAKDAPFAEAIYSARAYFFWPKDVGLGGLVRFPMCDKIIIEDSKKCLDKILKGQLLYCYSPQIYSGGFHRRTLIRRVINAKGRYFFTAIPDANSALNALLFTTRFVRSGTPLAVVGTSPKRSEVRDRRLAKDRDADHLSALSGSGVDLHPLVNDYPHTTFSMAFLETYLSAAPIVNLREVDQKFILPMVYRAVLDHQRAGLSELGEAVCLHNGFGVPTEADLQIYRDTFPEEVPDPLDGSTVYTADALHDVETISQAIHLMIEVSRARSSKLS